MHEEAVKLRVAAGMVAVRVGIEQEEREVRVFPRDLLRVPGLHAAVDQEGLFVPREQEKTYAAFVKDPRSFIRALRDRPVFAHAFRLLIPSFFLRNHHITNPG